MGFSDFVALPPYLSELIDYVVILFPNPACTAFEALTLHSVALLVVAGGQLLMLMMMLLRLFLPVTWVLLLGRDAWQYFPSSSFVCHSTRMNGHHGLWHSFYPLVAQMQAGLTSQLHLETMPLLQLTASFC